MRRTKIVCTLGPSSDDLDTIRALVRAGMNVARLNFSHGTHEAHAATFERVRQAAEAEGANVAALMDLQGPKIRTGRLAGGPIELEPDQPIVITTEDILGTAERISTTYEHLPQDVKPGDRILMADGTLELQVERVEDSEVHCRVVLGGTLGEHKGMNLPRVPVSAPSLTEKDVEDLAFGLTLGFDYLALSFVRKAADIEAVRRHIREADKDVRVVAKIERPEAIDNFDEILAAADAVMVARGDLGVEVPLYEVPQIQKDLIRRCNAAGKPVITATQMLESMVDAPRPTRAEVNDVANAIYDGTDAVMLSGETAAGRYPERACATMAQIAEEADAALARQGWDHPPNSAATEQENSFSLAIGHAAAHAAAAVGLKRIVCFTSSGYTAGMIARFRPQVPITAFTLSEAAARRCALLWGVEACAMEGQDDLERMIALASKHLLERALSQPGDAIAVIAGTPLAVAGRTNFLKLVRLGTDN